MSLRKLIKDSNKNKKEETTVSSTVRLSVEMNSMVEEIAEHLSLSKQKMFVELIKEGLDIAQQELSIDEVSDKDHLDKEKINYHIFNTNKGNDSSDGIRMIKEQIVSAFYNPWKLEVDKIKKGNIVFLYENGEGIIAFGEASGETIITDRNGDKDEMHYQKLSNFIRLEKPLKASQIKKILNRELVFMRTRIDLYDGDIILDILKKRKML